MTTLLSPVVYWTQIICKSYDGDVEAQGFQDFVRTGGNDTFGCKAGVCTYITDRQDYKDQLKQLGCQRASPDDDTTWTLPAETLHVTFYKAMGKIRAYWHVKNQIHVQKLLYQALKRIHSPLHITNKQRLILFKEFARNHIQDNGSVSVIHGLVGFFRFQLRHRYRLVEWTMSEYVLTQNNEEPIEDYVRMLKGVLGFQVKYQQPQDFDHESIVAPVPLDAVYPDETFLTWRMNPDMDNQFIYDLLNCLPHQKNIGNANDYQTTRLPRNQITTMVSQQPYQNVLQWLINIFCHCLSFLF